jgi:hypothetical protein
MGEAKISGLRIRIGMVLLIIWWIPFWLLDPILVKILSIDSPAGKHSLLIIILVTQTILGLIGILIAGSSVIRLVRQTPNRQIPKTFWHALKQGNI